jgi:hypothetical protein
MYISCSIVHNWVRYLFQFGALHVHVSCGLTGRHSDHMAWQVDIQIPVPCSISAGTSAVSLELCSCNRSILQAQQGPRVRSGPEHAHRRSRRTLQGCWWAHAGSHTCNAKDYFPFFCFTLTNPSSRLISFVLLFVFFQLNTEANIPCCGQRKRRRYSRSRPLLCTSRCVPSSTC